MSMSTTQLAERFGCVSMTLEMPFKDNFDLPDPVYGWSPQRSKYLACACLDALHAILPELKAGEGGRGLMPTLVLLRHGQSQWNLENRFTGWWDVDLTDKGVAEARAAGGCSRPRASISTAASPASRPARSARSTWCSSEMDRLWLPVTKDWRLNERHYGGLTGLNKQEMIDKVGAEQVKIWRRSFDIPPPPLTADSPYDVGGDRRYAGIAVPRTESLKDTIARVLPYYEAEIAPALRARQARARLGARQFAARARKASVEHRRRGDRRARNPDRPADRLRARRRSRGQRPLLSERTSLSCTALRRRSARPRFTRYIAWSARAMTVVGLSSGADHRHTDRDAQRQRARRRCMKSQPAIWSTSRAAVSLALSLVGMLEQDRRTRRRRAARRSRSCGRRRPAVSATWISAASPALWPKLSLIILSPSRSTNSIAAASP